MLAGMDIPIIPFAHLTAAVGGIGTGTLSGRTSVWPAVSKADVKRPPAVCMKASIVPSSMWLQPQCLWQRFSGRDFRLPIGEYLEDLQQKVAS